MRSKDKNNSIMALKNITIDSDPSELAKIYGPRSNRAWELLKSRKIIKYIFRPSGRIRWIVEGRGREYLILPYTKYCDCDDFYFGVVYGESLACQHLIAHSLAVTLNDYKVKAVADSQIDHFMEKWRRAKPLSYPTDTSIIAYAERSATKVVNKRSWDPNSSLEVET